MRESIGMLLYLLFVVLTMYGTALGIAAAFALLDRNRLSAGMDGPGFRAGRCGPLRRYGLCWLMLAGAWLLGASLVTRI